MRVIKNRDIPVLEGIIAVMADISSLENRMQWIRERQTNITAHLSWTHGGGKITGLDESFAELSDIEEKYQKAIKRYTKETRKVERIVNGIQNRNMRAFVRLMYVDGKTNTEVIENLCMTRRGFENARDAVESADCMDTVIWTDKYYEDKKG